MIFIVVGLLGLEPSLPDPQPGVIPIYYVPRNYLSFERVFLHLAQAKTRLPFGSLVHCKLGYCLLLVVGLNLVARSWTLCQTSIDFFPQIVQ